MGKNPIIWALLDDKIGHANQVLGVCEALGLPFMRKQLAFNGLSKLPNSLQSTGFYTLSSNSDDVRSETPDLVIACGRRTTTIARAIKRASGGHTKTVQIMWPGGSSSGLDLIAVPQHDNITPAEHIVTTLGIPHHITPDSLNAARNKWQPHFTTFTQPLIAVMVGGTVGKSTFTLAHATELVEQLQQLQTNTNAHLYFTTSRRTPDVVTGYIRAQFVNNSTIYSGDGKNPYHGLLAHADAFIITGDSVSMLSEACVTGKPVAMFRPSGFLPKKHSAFCDSLINKRHSVDLTAGNLEQFGVELLENRNYIPLPNAAHELAQIITERFLT